MTRPRRPLTFTLTGALLAAVGTAAMLAPGCEQSSVTTNPAPVEDTDPGDVAPDAPEPDADEDAPLEDGGSDVAADVVEDAEVPPQDHAARAFPAEGYAEGGVRVEVFEVPGYAPPPNPSDGVATPEELNATRVVRFRADVEPAAPVRAVLLAMPGFLAGAGAWDGLARALVQRGQDEGVPVEVWALDRRANRLEDLRGMDTGELAQDAEIAWRYYFGDDTIDGAPFAGFVPPGDVTFMSEWGLTTHVEDVRRVVGVIDAASRRGHVVLMGHSLGASFAELYGAWRFEDGTRAIDDLAGLVLIDGAIAAEPIAEEDWRGGANFGGFPSPGVDGVRDGAVLTALPLLGVGVYVEAELLGMRARFDPEGVVDDPERSKLLNILMGVPAPPMTNAAAVGFGFDNDHCPLAFAQLKMGRAAGGPLEEYDNFLGMIRLSRPTDTTATYTWTDAAATDPAELTPIGSFARGLSAGPTNFAEWYFPTRLPLDIAASGGAALDPEGWQAAAGLRAFDGPLNDAPILAIAADLAPVAAMEGSRGRVAPTIGEGRPQQGATRDADEGWQVIDATHMAHVDVVMAPDGPDNPIPAAIITFVERNTEAGEDITPATP